MKVKCHKLFETNKGITSATYEMDVKNKDEFIKKIKDSYLALCEIQNVEPFIEQYNNSITFRREHIKGNGIMNTYKFSA